MLDLTRARTIGYNIPMNQEQLVAKLAIARNIILALCMALWAAAAFFTLRDIIS